MSIKEIDALIRYHQNGLDQYRQHMTPEAQYLEEQTIKRLLELRKTYEPITNQRSRSENAG